MSATQANYLVAGVLWIAVVIYACFAGADFGGGVWDLFARGPRKEAQRRAVSRAMGPVWEANHVWLIFLITGLFTSFSPAFVRLAVGLYLPFSLALLGIVLRGAAFAFRAHGAPEESTTTPWGLAFGAASIMTPFVLGACAGAVAAGDVPANPSSAFDTLVGVWTTPFCLVCGGLALSICAGLAAAYLTVEASDAGDTGLAEDFRRRALLAGAVTLVLAIVALPLLTTEAPGLWTGLTTRGLPLVILAVVFAAAAAWAMYTRHYRLARLAAPAQVAAILLGWAVAQAPYLVPPDLTVDNSASPPQVMTALLIAYVAGAAVLFPSLLLLFRVFKGQNPAAV
ncbi:MAG: cytochrome d ubiquinol oxidase subunit II [Candidatus Dormiibacterota bacterium]